ncbi:MAG: hypothetical protein ACFFBJ_02650 [Promethearchaeota archaeon]
MDPQTISIIIAASSVIIGVIFSVASILMSTRNATRSRQASIFMKFLSVVSDKEFFGDFQQILGKWKWTDAEDFSKKYGPATNPSDYGTFVRIVTQFDSMGTLVRNKLTDIMFMPRGIAIMVTSFWERFKPIASDLEVMWGNADVFGEVEFLYNEIKKSRVSVLKN